MAIISAMKKVFFAVAATVMILIGLCIRGDVTRLNPYSVVYEGNCTRVETDLSAEIVVSRLNATVLWTENFDGVTVYYCYSDAVNGYEKVCSKRVNVMIAEREQYTAVGIPLLTGSY